MPKLESISDAMQMEITYTSGDMLSQKNHYVLDLVKHVTKMDGTVPLVSFTVEELQEANNFSYNIVAEDGREWTQTIKIINADPQMNFDVPDFWKLSEFSLQRAIRDTIIPLILEHGVTKIEITML